MQKITPFLWFEDQAEQAARFYVSLFRGGRIARITHYSKASAEAGERPEGSVMTVEFELEGQAFVALNGGSSFSFTPAISFMVSCETQAELDRLWDNLSEGGQTMPCGWLTDKYGVTWQITPKILLGLIHDPDPAKAERTMRAMLQMGKLDIQALQDAHDGVG